MARIGVVGAGIIGSAISSWLLADGHDVIVFERDPWGLPASSGNAGLIALPEISPLATPGILTSVPGWLLDPLGPLTIRWRDLPALTPWLIAFLGSAKPARIARARIALSFLMGAALGDHEALAKRIRLSGHMRQTGYLSVCDNHRGLQAASMEADLVRRELGYDYEILEAKEARRLVPQLEGAFAGAVHMPAYWKMRDPSDYLRALQRFVAQRGALITAEALALLSTDEQVCIVDADGGRHNFDKVVIAAGVWSRDLVRPLGLKVLLETERGYNTTFSELGWQLAMPVGFSEHGFVASPLANALRIGGAVELAAPEAPPNFARAQAMRKKMRKYVPALPEDGGTEWMGRRPSTPDSLPVISRHPHDRRIIFAFGHGHLGLTLSGVTARHVARLTSDSDDDSDLAPFDIRRFQ